MFTFIVGFPKNFDENLKTEISEKIPTTLSCRYVSGYFEMITDDDIECLTREIATCGSHEVFNKPIEHEDGYMIFQPDEFFQNINLKDREGISVTVSGYAECLHYVNGGYSRIVSDSNVDRTPKINKLFFYLVTLGMVIIGYFNRKNKQQNKKL